MAKRPSKSAATKSAATTAEKLGDAKKYDVNVTMRVAVPGMCAWLKVTSQKSGYFVYVPLPIRLIHQIPDKKGGGCIVRGAHGDESTAKESIVEIMEALNGYPIGGAISTWAPAG